MDISATPPDKGQKITPVRLMPDRGIIYQFVVLISASVLDSL